MRLVRHCGCSFPLALVLEERRHQLAYHYTVPSTSKYLATNKRVRVLASSMSLVRNLNSATSHSSKPQYRLCLKDTFLIHKFPGRLAVATRPERRARLVCSKRYGANRPKAETSKALSQKTHGKC